MHKYLILGRTLDKHTQSLSSTEMRLFLSLLLMAVKQEKACSHKKTKTAAICMYIAFLWMAGYSSFTEIQNLSRDRSVNLILSVWSDCSSQSSSSSLKSSRKVAGSIPYVTGFFNWPNPSSRTMALGSTQALTEISTMNLPGDKGRPAGNADNLTAIYEPIV
jgi:hypothetical protein